MTKITIDNNPTTIPIEKWPHSLYILVAMPTNSSNMSAENYIAKSIQSAQQINQHNAKSQQPHSNQYFTGTLAEVKHHIATSLIRTNHFQVTNTTKRYIMLAFKIPEEINIKTHIGQRKQIIAANPQGIQAEFLHHLYYLQENNHPLFVYNDLLEHSMLENITKKTKLARIKLTDALRAKSQFTYGKLI